MRAWVERGDGHVLCSTGRYGVRVRRSADGIAVDAWSWRQPRWEPVHGSVVAITRATSRLLAADPRATGRVVAEAASLAGVAARDPQPVTAMVRAVLPLLASPEPWPLAGVPDEVPLGLWPAFRANDPRTAARRLFGPRATRPVVRAMSELLVAGPTVDVFTLSAAVAVAPLLEPDHLARVLRCRTTPDADRSGLDAQGEAGLRRSLAGTAPRRRVALLEQAVTDPAARRRARFVAAACPDMALDPGRSWDDATAAVLAAAG